MEYIAFSEDICADIESFLNKKHLVWKDVLKWERNGDWWAFQNSVCTKTPYFKDSPVIVLCDTPETAIRIACLLNMKKANDASY